MFGCLRKLGCLVVILAAIAAYFWYKHRYDRGPVVVPVTATWTPVTIDDFDRANRKIEQLRTKSGVVTTTLTPPQAVAYVLHYGARQVLSTADGLQTLVSGDTVHVKAVLSLNDFGGAKMLGPLASVLNARDTVLLSGTVNSLSQGFAQFRIIDARIRDLRIPSPILPRLARELRRKQELEGLHSDQVADDALPFALPSFISEIRVAKGKIIVFKKV